MGDHDDPGNPVTGDHERDQDQDQDVAADVADLLDRLQAALDPPARHDMPDKRAAHRLARAAQLARQRAQREQGQQ